MLETSRNYSPELNALISEIKKYYGYLSGEKVLMLFSGGLDTSFLAKVFTEEIGVNVNTLCFNLGDQRQPVDKIRLQSEKVGAQNHFEIDVITEFVDEYVLQSIKANARYNSKHPLSSSLSRPLMIKKAIEIAKQYGFKVIIQGTSPWQNNAPRFQKAFEYLSFETNLEMKFPVLELDISRELENEYLLSYDIEITERQNQIFSSDGNIWNWELEDGKIKLESFYRPDLQSDCFNIPENAPDKPQFVDITFEKGMPIKINEESYSLVEIIKKLNKIGGENGIGIYDALEARPIGFKEREIHVAPAADILISAHEDLEQAVLAEDTLTLKQDIDRRWTKAVCDGDWFRDYKEMMNSAINTAQEKVTGVVRLKLYKGHIDILGRKSVYSLDSNTLQIEKKIIPSQQGFKEKAFLSGVKH